MLTYLWVFLGGGLGSMARFGVTVLIASRLGAALFPFGTLLVNVTGCFLIGLLAGLTDLEGRFVVHPGLRQFFLIGVLGGYTTFSSFSLQTLELARAGEWLWAGVNAVGSLVGCLVAVWLGHLLALHLNRQ